MKRDYVGEELEIVAPHVEDDLRIGALPMANKPKTYRVTVTPPGSEQQTYTVVVADGTVLSAKAEASKLYYGHVFTGQFKYMRAKKVEIAK